MPKRIWPKRDLPLLDCGDRDIPAVREFLSRNGGIMTETKLDRVRLDVLGMVIAGEPEVAFEVNGDKFECLVRHLPAISQLLAKIHPISDWPGYRVFLPRGGMFAAVLSEDTAAALSAKIDALIRQGSAEIDLAEKTIERARAGLSGRMEIFKQCLFCGSSRPYSECCGKDTKKN